MITPKLGAARATRQASWLFLIVLTALGGCATRTVQNSGPEEPVISRPQPSTPAAPPVQALSQMLQDSRAQVDARNWQGAIVSAERGLRIDRREPELYLLLAKSYWALAELDRARQFARQGLRYINDPSTAIAMDLNDLLFALD